MKMHDCCCTNNNKRKNKQKSTYSLSISKNSSSILCIVCEFPKNKVQFATGSL